MAVDKTQALLVIDLQTGAFDGVKCDPIDAGDRLLDRAAELLDAARAAGLPVLHVQHGEPQGVLVKGTPQWQLHPAVAALPGEACVEKQAWSAFENTALDALLRESGVRRLLVCGLQSEVCVTHTSQAALTLGYEVTLASDAHGTWPDATSSADEIIARQNTALAALGAQLQGTREIVALLSR
ncbi:cysteine hydrolase family protein [Rhizobacter sp. SG703]|uniref:cysteine hydrolase family protein n=1 Tax=Rhizobacter sp. SG703 TaxID=2587140 RepID=UPI001445CE96|nr:cysteine hydrolase family protein [Rhizobacter sp. SG703]NKI97074.1 nicotinamidase-related amidase [Rhizobacter sp. SG703]